jgi:hypothetical protein
MEKTFTGGLPLPHDPLVKVYGVVVEKDERGKLKYKCKVYNSSVAPIKMVFKAKRFP